MILLILSFISKYKNIYYKGIVDKILNKNLFPY
jgi:hypothetical protein